MKPVIKEVIVVEGSHDSARLKLFFDCETIVTHGLGMKDSVIEQVREAKQRCGVIIFTDPDEPGRKIRARIDQAVPGCMHAFVRKEDARTTHKVGVEHASFEVLQDALQHTVTLQDSPQEQITAADFYELGLMGRENSEELRRFAAAKLHIGYGSAKGLRMRMNRLGVTAEELKGILKDA